MNSERSETIDELLGGSLRVIQAIDGYRSSLDPILLTWFVEAGREDYVLDLGTGNAVIPLILARHRKGQKIIGVDLQPAMVDRAQRSVRLNHLEDVIEILHGDVRNLSGKLLAGSFDAVVTNPPYRAGHSGRISAGSERAAARHELAGGLDDFLRAGAFLLKRSGRFYIIYPVERMTELLVGMRAAGLEPKRLRMVHSRISEGARLVLVEGRKNGRPGMNVEPPLIIYRGQGRDYTEEVLAMYGNKGTRDE